jgi:hypothetical protein
MGKQIFPADAKGRVLSLLSLSFVGYVYLDRVVQTEVFVGSLGGLLGFFFWISPILCMMGFIVHLILVTLYIFKFRSHLAPGLILIGGLLLAAFVPVPPSPEEISFSWQRDEYEQIVELARDNQLQQGDDCLAENQYLPRSSYYQWSSNCVYVYHHDGLIVEFAPRSLERPIVFSENPQSDRFPRCWSDRESRVLKQLSEHWYICKRFGLEQ